VYSGFPVLSERRVHSRIRVPTCAGLVPVAWSVVRLLMKSVLTGIPVGVSNAYLRVSARVVA